MATRLRVMIFGTYHMANPNLDYVKTQHREVLTPPLQRQIEGLVQRLSTFRPTHVAVEAAKRPAGTAPGGWPKAIGYEQCSNNVECR